MIYKRIRSNKKKKMLPSFIVSAGHSNILIKMYFVVIEPYHYNKKQYPCMDILT